MRFLGWRAVQVPVGVTKKYFSARSGGQALVVHTMGKVGSTAVLTTCEEQVSAPVFHTHTLSFDKIKELARRSLTSPLLEGLAVRRLLDSEREVHWRVVSLVRDPVARNISAFFQNLDHFGGGTDEIAALFERFMRDYPHDLPSRWFDDEVLPHFGVDVFGSEFDPKSGHAVFSRENVDLLVVRIDDLNNVGPRVLGEFLGLPGEASIGRENIGGDKSYSTLYSEALKKFRIPEKYVDECYATRFARHFYSDEEIAHFRERWAAR